MKKVIIFDFDGTILNTEPFIGKLIYETYLKFTNKRLTLEDILNNYGPSELGMLINMNDGSYNPNEAFDYYLKLYKKMHEQFFTHIDKNLKNIFEYLKLNDIDTYIITGRSKESLDISLDILDIRKYFKGFYTGSIKGVNKPTSIRNLISDHNYNNKELLYIGDTINDIKSMNEVDVKIISIAMYNLKNFEELNKLNPNNVVKDYLELDSKIKEFLKD